MEKKKLNITKKALWDPKYSRYYKEYLHTLERVVGHNSDN